MLTRHRAPTVRPARRRRSVIVDIAGSWINQNGSLLTLDAPVDGRLTGTFQSRKGRAARDRVYPVTGVVNGALVSFMVSFDDGIDNLHSITSFSGRWARDADGVERLHTVWVLARAFEDEARTKPTQAWNSFLVNADVFTRQD
jgi:hypothetical protein